MTQTPTAEELMRLACEVRDEDNEQANTALRVGNLLASIVSALSAAYPYTNVSVSRQADRININYTLVPDDGSGKKTFTLTLPTATGNEAGVMSTADKKKVDSIAYVTGTSRDAVLAEIGNAKYTGNPNLRMICWDAGSESGVVLQQRTRQNYVTQTTFGDSRERKCYMRDIDLASYVIHPWQELLIPTGYEYVASERKLRGHGFRDDLWWDIFTLPEATAGQPGLMSKGVYAALAGFGMSVPSSPGAYSVNITYNSPLNGKQNLLTLPAATPTSAGVMTAADKQQAAASLEGATVRFEAIVPSANIQTMSTMEEGGSVVYVESAKAFAYCVGMPSKYYNNWAVPGVPSADLFMNDARTQPLKGKIYVCGYDLYTWHPEGDKMVNILRDTATLARLQGRDPASNALSDSFLLLGNFEKGEGETDDAYWGRINAAIDGTFDLNAGTKNAKYCGDMRLSVSGQIVSVRQIALDFAQGRYLQVVSGAIRVDQSGKIAYAGSVYNTFWRYIDNGEAGAWKDIVPRRQAGKAAAEGEYAYSSGGNNAAGVASVLHGWVHSGGQLKLRCTGWAPSGQTGTNYDYPVPAATTTAAGAMSAEDKKLLSCIRDIGTFDSKDAACNYAARSEIAGDMHAALLIFHATGATGKMLEGRILQQVNGIDVSMQYLMWDKSVYRRNVTGANGVAGNPTNAFAWEETAPHSLKYDAPARRLSMQSYERNEVAALVLPQVSADTDGLMTAALVRKIQDLETRLAALEGQAAADGR